MPPYRENVSKAQERLMFATAARGDISQADAVGRARATKKDWGSLPERVKAIVARKRGTP
jgi:hypothetical protein